MMLKLLRKIKKVGRNPIIFMIIVSWVFYGWPPISIGLNFPPEIDGVHAEVAPLKINNKIVDFNFSDDNTDENLIIKTDKKNYIGLARGEVYFSVTNIGDKSELVNLQTYFPTDNGEVKQIARWTSNIPYEVIVPEYDSVNYFCEESWTKNIDNNIKNSECVLYDENDICAKYKTDNKIADEVFGYKCNSSGEIQNCDVLSEDGQNCIIEKVQVSLRKEIKYKTDWQNIELAKKPLSIETGFFDKLLGREIKRKSIPENLIVKKSTNGNGFNIEPNETQYFKMNIKFLANTSGEFYIEAIGDKGGYGLLDPWWSSSWFYRKQITIDHTKVDGTLSNFPVLIDLSSDSSLAYYAQDDADDIAFTSSDEVTQLNHEIEDFNGTTGELQAWVEIPSLSASSDTVIYMYYGNASCSSQASASSVWDSGHKLVQHLGDLTTATTEDSTSNNNNGTKRAANEPIETTIGKISNAQSLDGSNDYITITNNLVGTPTSLTISAWIKKESGGGTYECALHKGSTNTIGSSDYWLGVDINDQLTATIGANTGVGWAAGQTTTTANYGQWYHLAATWDGAVVKVYLDGEYNKQYNLSTYGNLTTPTRFGAANDGTTYQFRGVVDEMRISTSARGESWIKTSYNNQNSPNSFYTLGEVNGLAAPTLHDVPFNNEESTDTTPSFEFTGEDPSGTSDIVYQIEWDDNIDFSSPTTRTSDIHAGFVNTEDGSDTSPFTENQKIRFTIQAGDALTNNSANTSYYWRVRAKNDGGNFGAWTDINNLRINSSLSVSQWIQTTDEQFDGATLVDTITSGADSVILGTGTDVKAAKGIFTTPASTGNDSITGVGFQPKAVMFFAVPRTDENAGSHSSQFVGFSDGSNDKASSIKSEDGVSDNGRAQQNYAIYLRNVDTTNLAVATVNSFDSDGFTLNYTTTNPGYIIHYIAFGGDDLTAVVGEEVVSSSPLSGLPFAPDIMFLSTTGYTTPTSDDTHGISSFGVVADSGTWYLGNHQGSNTTVRDGRLSSNGCLTQAYNNGVTWEMASCSLTGDGMSWTGTNTDEFHYLALNTGGLDVTVGTFAKETTGVDGATQDLSGWGFTNNAAIVGFASAGKTDETFSDHVRTTIGAYDGTNQGMITFNDINGTTNSDSIQNNDYAIGIAEADASILAAGTASQLDGDGVRITWSSNNTTAYNIGYWAIEGSSGIASSGSITSPSIDYNWVSGVYSWDGLSWNDDETDGDIKYQMQYWDGNSWELIPDGALAGNSSGFDNSPVDLSGLNTATYNQIRAKANFTNLGGTPILQDWLISWAPPDVSISISTDGVVSFDYLPLEGVQDTTATGIDDVEVVLVDTGPADLDIRSTVFTEGSNTWTLNTSNDSNQVKWEFSPDGSNWSTFTAADTLYSLATDVAQSSTQDTYFRITMPTISDSYDQYSATVTVVASAP